MKALVVGLGMGGLYAKILQDKGANVVTVDADVNRNAHYTDLTQCLDSQKESQKIDCGKFEKNQPIFGWIFNLRIWL